MFVCFCPVCVEDGRILSGLAATELRGIESQLLSVTVESGVSLVTLWLDMNEWVDRRRTLGGESKIKTCEVMPHN